MQEHFGKRVVDSTALSRAWIAAARSVLAELVLRNQSILIKISWSTCLSVCSAEYKTCDRVHDYCFDTFYYPSSAMSKGETELTWAALKQDPEVKERSDKIGKILHSQIMDFRLNSPDKLAICVSRLLQMFNNILQYPDSAKFRKVQ